MADIKIIVQYETVTRAKKEVKQLASTTVSLDKAQKKSSTTTNKLANETHKLALKYKPLYASSKLYERNLSEINRANKLGVLSDKQRQASLDNLNNQFATGTGVFSSYANGMTKGSNRMGVAMQQTGYQVGDFLVQVQAGTNPMVAFGQQATQLVGVMYLLPQATLAAKVGIMGLKISMGALAMSLGILIPLATAIGAALLRTKKEAKGASEGIISIKDASKEAIKEISNLRVELELLQSGAAGAQELALNKAIFEMYNKIYDFKNKILDLSYADAQTILTIKEAIAGASDESKNQLAIYEDQLLSLKRQRDAIIVNKKLLGSEVGEAGNEQANTRRRIRADVERGKELAKQANQRQQNVLEGIAIFRAANNKADAERILAEENRQKTVLEGIAIFRAANERIEDERLAVQERIQQNQLEDTKYFYDYKAKREAEDLAMAIRVAEIKEELRQKEYAGMQGRRGARGPSAIEIAEMGMGPQITDAQSKLEAQEKLNKKQDEYLATLRLSTQEQLMTAGLKDRELLVAEQFNETYKTQLELDKLGIKYGSAKYERALETLKTQQESILYVYDMVEAEKKLTEEKEKQGELIDTIGGIIGDGFISMVEGTESVKDAFKNMARAIIKELYQILVVQQMVNAAKAAFGIPVPNADGGVFSSGSIQAYADGGVVGSPTTFPMSGGRTGLMGEAGPEAIMPLKRGANGKLGVQMEGGGATTVVQNFNFSANGDDSVKRIIAQAAPKIAQMTKSEIINDRRRGGTMKATFG